MNKYFLASKFRSDFFKTEYFLTKGYRVIEAETGFGRTKLHDFASGKHEKIDCELFFTLCTFAKLKPLDYYAK